MNKTRRIILKAISALTLTGKSTLAECIHQNLVSVRDFGAHGDGVHDDSKAIIAASHTGSRLYFPPGRYKFLSEENPNLQNGVVCDNAHIDGLAYRDILVFDADQQTLIGLQHNHLQQSSRSLKGNYPIHTGVILEPPLAAFSIPSQIDIVAHWYNDFGLEYTRVGNGTNGSLTWYYWDWAFSNTGNYDPSRHPLLGWYRGDDQNVLDWQCYWLKKYGIDAVCLTGSTEYDKWHDREHRDYWKYQLFNNTKNFQFLKYIPWVKYSGSFQEITNHWLATCQFMNKYKNNYIFSYKNKKWVVFYVFEGKELAKIISKDNQTQEFIGFLRSLKHQLQKEGVDGLAIFVRKLADNGMVNLTDLEKEGILFLPAGYEGISGSKGKSYNDLVESFSLASDIKIVNVATSKSSKFPHPSRWAYEGSTPSFFRKLLSKAFGAVLASPIHPKVIQIYNVSEWAEGGPGLQPNMQDGFGYLEAVRDVKKSFSR